MRKMILSLFIGLLFLGIGIRQTYIPIQLVYHGIHTTGTVNAIQLPNGRGQEDIQLLVQRNDTKNISHTYTYTTSQTRQTLYTGMTYPLVYSPDQPDTVRITHRRDLR